MRVSAPAKINLYLRVGPVRADGFHPLSTWMCTVALFDILVIRRAGGEGVSLTIADGNDDDVLAASEMPTELPKDGSGSTATGITVDAVSGPSSGRRGGNGDGKSTDAIVPADATNLVVRAASSWVTTRRARTTEASGSQASLRGLSIVLRKRIPVGAGLGGGSSDAARTLMALNALDDANWSPDQLAALGARLGSDVPFFFHGPSSLCTGRGEIVTPVPPPLRAKWVILYLPGIPLSTAHIYQRFDELKLGSDVTTAEPDGSSWATLPATELMSRLVNDLEAPAFDVCPQLGQLRATLERTTGRVVRMSGSGSSLFSLADDHPTAMTAVEAARKSYSGRIEVVELCPT